MDKQVNNLTNIHNHTKQNVVYLYVQKAVLAHIEWIKNKIHSKRNNKKLETN